MHVFTWFTRGLLALLVLVLLAPVGGYLWLRTSLPELEGEMALTGLTAPVEVLRDADGLVTIRAQSEADAYRALGFVHAQDRLWQMDFFRLTAAGRLSEVVGSATLSLDRTMRGLGFAELAEANYQALSAPAKAALEAYSAGVNDYINTAKGARSPALLILRRTPEPWRPSDSLLWGRLMALQLSLDWRGEALRAGLSQNLTDEDMRVLWPSWKDQGPTTVAGLAGLDFARIDAVSTLPWRLAPKSASNLWVIAGSKSESGKPLLTNDPHLGLESPGLWYLVRLETPTLTLAGATAPGVPFHIFGHNSDIAWAITSTEADVQDLFVEQLVEDQPSHYETPEGPAPFELRHEIIRVRDEAPVEVTYRSSRHGPVVEDLKPGASPVASDKVLALSWPALNPNDRTGEALYRLNRATSWTDFRQALVLFNSPVQNLAYADRTGHIGFTVAGLIPIRPQGPSLVPVPGWSGEYDWQGFIPAAQLPHVLDPESGFIVNGNNRVVGPDYPYRLSATWPEPTRAERIWQRLNAEPIWSTESAYRLLTDDKSLGAQQLLPRLLELLKQSAPNHPEAKTARRLLERWDYGMDRQATAPLIFVAWANHLSQRLLAPRLGKAIAAVPRSSPNLLFRVLRDRRGWCDDGRTAKLDSCAEQAAVAFDLALSDLAARFGNDPNTWRWGSAHIAAFPHPVFRQVPFLNALIGFGVETDGGADTINRAVPKIYGAPDQLYQDIHGPGFRATYDLSNLDRSRFMIATGQSGNPLSPYYGNLAKRWSDGDSLMLVGGEQATGFRLRLLPR